MQSQCKTVNEYIEKLPEERKEAVKKLREAILKSLPSGFEEGMGYGMAGYVVPHKIYPAGYHCNPKTPLPFAGFASQKNFISLYHMGLYADPKLYDWFVAAYPKHSRLKLDMGKSCIRFKKTNEIPLALISELFSKMSVQDWIELYEKNLKK